MHKTTSGIWRCLTHSGPEWEAAQSMGAQLPCRLPLAHEGLQDLARSPFIDLHVARLLIQEGDEFTELVAANPATPEALLLQLSEHPWKPIQRAAAGNSSIPRPIQEQWARSRDDRRAALAGSRSCPAAILQILCQDSDEQVRLKVAGNWKAPAEVLAQLVADDVPAVRRALADNSSTPKPILKQLAADPHPAVRGAVAHNHATPHEVLWQLSDDPDGTVRKAVASRRLPEALCQKMARDPKSSVQAALLDDLPISEPALLILAQSKHRTIRDRVLDRTDLPISVLMYLSKTPHLSTKRRAARRLRNAT